MSMNSTIKERIYAALNSKDYVKENVDWSNYCYTHIATDSTIVLYLEEERIGQIELECDSFPKKLCFVFPINPNTDIFGNILDNIVNIHKDFNDYVQSYTTITQYYKIGDDLIGLCDGNKNSLFSFKNGFLEEMTLK